MSSNQKEKEQKIGLWVAGSAAGLAVLVILFLSVCFGFLCIIGA